MIYKQAKKTGSWSQYKHFQKQCKREFRKAEWEHINNTIQEGLDKKNLNHFGTM